MAPATTASGTPLLVVLQGVGAALVAAILHLRSPLPDQDPFRDTLAALPLILLAFSHLRRAAIRRGGRAPASRWRTVEVVGTGALVALILTRGSYGLLLADALVAAVALLLLAAHVRQQLLGLRPLLGHSLPARPSLLFMALPLTVYLAILPWSARQHPPDGDEPWYLLVTHSLAHDFDADLTNNYAEADWIHFMDRRIEPQPGDPRGPNGEIFSRHNQLLPLILAPAYRIAGKLGALAMMALLTAAVAWQALSLAQRYAPTRPGEALLAYALIAFTPPLLLYSYQVWIEVPAALLILVALERIRAYADETAKPRDGLVCALALILLPLLKIRLALFSGPLVILAIWYGGRQSKARLAILATSVALGAASLLMFNQWLYGNALKIHSWSELELYRYPLDDFGRSFAGLFWDVAFGLFASGPLWLIILPSAILLATRRSVMLLDFAVCSLPYLILVASRREWYGGWSPPFRYGLAILPLLGLLPIALLSERRRAGARMILAFLAAASLALGLIWVTVPGWTYNLADGRTLLLDHLGLRLGADATRFFPSFVRPRAANWLVPVLASAVVCLAFWWPSRPSRRAWAGGLSLFLLVATTLPLAALRLPTGTLEVEAPHVSKEGGEPWPPRWQIDRTRNREGWHLSEGEGLHAPIVPGGDTVALEILAREEPDNAGPLQVEVRAGKTLIARVGLDQQDGWQYRRTARLSWPCGATDLSLSIVPAGGRPPTGSRATIDHVKLRWGKSPQGSQCR